MRRARAVFRPNVKSVATASRAKAPTTKDSPSKVPKEELTDKKEEQKILQATKTETKQQPEAKTLQNASFPLSDSSKPAQVSKSSITPDTSVNQHDKNSGKNPDVDNTLDNLSNKGQNKTDVAADVAESQKDAKASTNDRQNVTSTGVRRKRLMAVPNLGRSRQGGTTPGKPVKEEKKPAQSDGGKSEESVEKDKEFQEPPPVQRITEAFASKPPPRHIPPLIIPRRRLDSTSSVDGREGSERPLTIPHRERRVSGMYTPNIQPERRREKDQEEEEGPAKRRQRHNQSKPPDKNRMTMADLIYYNPKSNMMKSTEEKAKRLKEKKKHTKDSNDAASERGQEEENEEDLLEDETRQDKDTVAEEPDVDDSLLVPQVRVAEDGTIVLNEQSLTVSTPAKKAGSDSDIVQEDESNTTYSSFRKKVPQTQAWNMKETIKFYKALSTVGTDFTLMAAMIPKRTRAQLKAKFKKEEKQNRNLVDRALALRQEFDMSIFDQSESDSEDEKKKRKENTSRRGKGRPRGTENEERSQPAGKRKASDNHDGEPVSVQCRLSTPLTASSGNVSGYPNYGSARTNLSRDAAAVGDKHDKERSEDADDENEEEETRITQMLKGPTRAGRQPKRVQTFSINVEPTRKRARPPTVVNRASPIASPPRFSPLQGSVGSAARKRWLYIPGETGPRTERSQSQESGKEQTDNSAEEMIETVMIQSPVRLEPQTGPHPVPQLLQGTALNGSVVVGDVEELVITDDEGNRPTSTTAQYALLIPVVNSNSPSGQTVSVVVPSSSTVGNTVALGENTSPGAELRFVMGEHLTAQDILEQMQMEGRERGEEEEASGEEEVVIREEMITEIATEIAKEQPDVDHAGEKDAEALEAES